MKKITKLILLILVFCGMLLLLIGGNVKADITYTKTVESNDGSIKLHVISASPCN